MRNAGSQRRALNAPIVIGHANGGMLAVKHCAENTSVRALVLLSAPASLQSAGRFCAFFSGPEIPFPGNGRPREAETRFECRLRRRKSEHVVLPRPSAGGPSQLGPGLRLFVLVRN